MRQAESTIDWTSDFGQENAAKTFRQEVLRRVNSGNGGSEGSEVSERKRNGSKEK